MKNAAGPTTKAGNACAAAVGRAAASKMTVVAASLMALAGCAIAPPPPALNSAPVPNIDLAIQRSVASVEKLLGELVLLERGRADGAQFKSAAEALPPDDPLQKKGSLVWMGDARVVLGRIAAMAGLEFASNGRSPTALVVAIDMQDRPLAAMLEAVATQVGSTAKVVYDPGEKMIELRYQ